MSDRMTFLPGIRRLLPQALEAERALLGCFLREPEVMGPICRERGVNSAIFHLPAHAVVFEELSYMWGERMPCDGIAIGHSLQSRGLLESIGGLPYITELCTSDGVTVYAFHYIEILQEKRAARDLISACTSFIDRAYDSHEELAGLFADAEAHVSALAREQASAGLREKLSKLAFDVHNPPPRLPPIFKLAGVPIATAGNVLAIQAKAKAGKSAALQGMMGSAMQPDGDCLGFESENEKGFALLHFDTEQSDADHDDACRNILRRAGKTAPPEWFVSYRVTALTIPERFAALRMELPRLRTKHGGILAVVLDGAADLGHDPNDSKEAFAIVDELHRLAGEFKTVVVCVLHENPGENSAGKTRGHLGSQLERKAETNLRLEKNVENVTVMYSVRARHAHLPKDKGPRFAWCHEQHMHLSTASTFADPGKKGRDPDAPRRNARVTQAKAILGRYFAQGATQRRSLLSTAVPTEAGISPRSFDNYWGELRTGKWIVEVRGVRGLFEATPAWVDELAADFPEESNAE